MAHEANARDPIRPRSWRAPFSGAMSWMATSRCHPIWMVCAGGLLLVVMIAVGAGLILLNLRDRTIRGKEHELQSLSLAIAAQADHTFQAIELIQNAFIGRIHDLGISSRADFEQRMAGENIHRNLRDITSGLPF